MKQTGIIRPLDHLGRIVLPKELRRTFDINPEDFLEIFVEDDRIILQKYEATCIFCHGSADIQLIKGKPICHACLDELKTIE